MRLYTYRFMFVLVASGSIISFISGLLTVRPHFLSYFRLLTAVGGALPLALSGLTSPIVFVILKWLYILLVIHRLYRITSDRSFCAPVAFRNVLYVFGVIGCAAWLVAFMSIGAATTLGFGGVLFAGFALIVPMNTFPVAFAFTELLSLRSYLAKTES